MFERYTEGARRTIFFARYEATQTASAYIDTEHLLLGLFREDKALFKQLLPGVDYESIRKEVAAAIDEAKKLPPSTDLPLSNASKRALAYGAEEAERLNHHHIGTEHLLLGLLREEEGTAAKFLRQYGADLIKMRLEISKRQTPWFSGKMPQVVAPIKAAETVEIHGSKWSVAYLYDTVKRCREHNWHWHKCLWKPRDIVLDIKQGSVSFDLKLAEDSVNFRLVEGGWKKDHCAVCRWELFESKDDPAHGTAYTNGIIWLCTECYEKFWRLPNFFDSEYSEIN
jgi:Clp amino terminal domain, pathogenicity island component